MYIGPFLIVRVIPPCNFVLQKNARSKPIVTHTDKLKKCWGPTPKSWLTESDVTAAPTPSVDVEKDQKPSSEDESGIALQSPAGREEVSQPQSPPRTTDSGRGPILSAQSPPGVVERNHETQHDSPVAAGHDDRVLRDRGQLKRPARFKD